MPPRAPSLVATLLAVSLLSLAPDTAASQSVRNPTVRRGAPPAGETDSPARVTVRIDGRDYAFTGAARCMHAPRASLFDKPGKNWSVQVQPTGGSGLRSLALTLWRFDDPAARPSISFSTTVDAATHRISTSDAGQGRGEATFTPQGAGGQIELTGRTAKGTPIKATIDCARFTAPYAVGG